MLFNVNSTSRRDKATSLKIRDVRRHCLRTLAKAGVTQEGRKADKHVTSRPHILHKAKQYLIRQVVNHRSFLTFITSGIPTQCYEIDLFKAQEKGLKFNQPFSFAVVHVGDSPTECLARVAPHAPTIQADFRASGDRLLDQSHQELCQLHFTSSSQKRP